MKNIHVLTTDKPSRLAYDFDKLILNSRLLSPILYKTQNIYITSNEEIKEGDWFIALDGSNDIYKANKVWLGIIKNNPNSSQKIILTTDQDLIKDGVQAIDDEFLEWFVKNPSCEEVEVLDLYGKNLTLNKGGIYKIIIPKEKPKQDWFCPKCDSYVSSESVTFDETHQTCNTSVVIEKPNYNMKQEILAEMNKQETLEEFIKEELEDVFFTNISERKKAERLIELGAKWQQERSYSGEEVLEMMRITRRNEDWTVSQLFEQFKKK